MKAIVTDPIFLKKLLQSLENIISSPRQQNGLLFRFHFDTQQLQLTFCEYNDKPTGMDSADASGDCDIRFIDSIMNIWCQSPFQSLGMKILTTTSSTLSFVASFDTFNKCFQSASESSIILSFGLLSSKNHAKITLSSSITSSKENVNLEQHIHVYLLDSEQELLISEPFVPCPQIHVRFQSIQRLKSMVHGLIMFFSRSKSKGNMKGGELFITGTVHRSSEHSDQHIQTCSLNFKLVHSNAKLNMSTTIWSGDDMNYVSTDNKTNSSYDTMQSTVKIMLKDLHHALHCDSLPPDSIVLGISDKYALVFYVNWPPAMLTFVIPSRFIE